MQQISLPHNFVITGRQEWNIGLLCSHRPEFAPIRDALKIPDLVLYSCKPEQARALMAVAAPNCHYTTTTGVFAPDGIDLAGGCIIRSQAPFMTEIRMKASDAGEINFGVLLHELGHHALFSGRPRGLPGKLSDAELFVGYFLERHLPIRRNDSESISEIAAWFATLVWFGYFGLDPAVVFAELLLSKNAGAFEGVIVDVIAIEKPDLGDRYRIQQVLYAYMPHDLFWACIISGNYAVVGHLVRFLMNYVSPYFADRSVGKY